MLGLGNNVIKRRGPFLGFNPLDYNPHAVWDSQHITVVSGGADVATDFSSNGLYDLAAPAATNRGTYTASDADFNNLPSVEFDGVDDYLYKSVANFLSGESSGEIFHVIKIAADDDVFYELFASADEVAVDKYFLNRVRQDAQNDSIAIQIATGVVNDAVYGDGNAKAATVVLNLRSDGSVWALRINNNEQTLTILAGANNGLWLADIPDRDNVTIGALIRNSNSISNQFKWAFTGIYPLLSTADRNELITGLIKKYGITV